MRGIRVLYGMLAIVAGVALLLGAGLLAWMLIAGSAGWAPWLVVVGMLGVAVAGARTFVVATPKGLRILGEPTIAWDDIVEVCLTRDKDARYPRLTLARGRLLEERDLDGLATLSAKHLQATVAFLATSAGAAVVEHPDEDQPDADDTPPAAPRRGM